MSTKPSNTKVLLTPDEIRVVLLWASAYVAEHPPNCDQPIVGQDNMFAVELLRLSDKLADVSTEFMLGAINVAYLLGFSTFSDKSPPLNKVWRILKRFYHAYCSDTKTPKEEDVKNAWETLEKFLNESHLV